MRDRAQGLPANVHGSMRSEVMSGQRQHSVATPWWKKWQPPQAQRRMLWNPVWWGEGNTSGKALEWGLEGCIVPDGGGRKSISVGGKSRSKSSEAGSCPGTERGS